MTEILTETVTQKIEAEEKLKEEKNKNYEYKRRYDLVYADTMNSSGKIRTTN